ncbi:MAG: hypothetical protein JNM56_17000 [Planctomycetia bacterium]|nr:hypothetical protein [Planctomycetia bacterium]
MTSRQTKLLWMKDMLDHLQACHRQLQWTENDDAARVVTDTMLRDLESCRRLCEDLDRRGRLQRAV